jgi:hypothetical protein
MACFHDEAVLVAIIHERQSERLLLCPSQIRADRITSF